MKKLIITVITCIAIYYAFHIGRAIRLSILTWQCMTSSDREAVDNNNISVEEKLKISVRVFSCAKDKQTFIDRFFYIVPEGWTKVQQSK